MPPKEENPGLLSKVVRFVKNPATGWGDLEPDTEREDSYSKQMLKEMIERKRRNDFVRKREFDMLRKMRRSEVMAGQDPMARPSFFQSSMPSKPTTAPPRSRRSTRSRRRCPCNGGRPSTATTPRAWAAAHFPMSSHVPPDAMSDSLGAGAAVAAAASAAAQRTRLYPHRPVPLPRDMQRPSATSCRR
jgi:hypothetical protein